MMIHFYYFRIMSPIISSSIRSQPLPLAHSHEPVLPFNSLPVSTTAHALMFQVLLRGLRTTAPALGTTMELTANTLMPVPPAHVKTVAAVLIISICSCACVQKASQANFAKQESRHVLEIHASTKPLAKRWAVKALSVCALLATVEIFVRTTLMNACLSPAKIVVPAQTV